MAKKPTNQVKAKLYRGQPNVKVEVEIDESSLDESLLKGGLSISLESLDVDLHNQSYGLVRASTGCISNPGGPSC